MAYKRNKRIEPEANPYRGGVYQLWYYKDENGKTVGPFGSERLALRHLLRHADGLCGSPPPTLWERFKWWMGFV